MTQNTCYGYEHQDGLDGCPIDAANTYVEMIGLENVEWPIKIDEYERMKIGDQVVRNLAGRTLDGLLEWLDEGFGDPEEATDETPSMRAKALEFVRSVVDEYHVWGCEKTGNVIEVNREDL